MIEGIIKTLFIGAIIVVCVFILCIAALLISL